jgi:hypothetical protein
VELTVPGALLGLAALWSQVPRPGLDLVCTLVESELCSGDEIRVSVALAHRGATRTLLHRPDHPALKWTVWRRLPEGEKALVERPEPCRMKGAISLGPGQVWTGVTELTWQYQDPFPPGDYRVCFRFSCLPKHVPGEGWQEDVLEVPPLYLRVRPVPAGEEEALRALFDARGHLEAGGRDWKAAESLVRDALARFPGTRYRVQLRRALISAAITKVEKTRQREFMEEVFDAVERLVADHRARPDERADALDAAGNTCDAFLYDRRRASRFFLRSGSSQARATLEFWRDHPER